MLSISTSPTQMPCIPRFKIFDQILSWLRSILKVDTFSMVFWLKVFCITPTNWRGGSSWLPLQYKINPNTFGQTSLEVSNSSKEQTPSEDTYIFKKQKPVIWTSALRKWFQNSVKITSKLQAQWLQNFKGKWQLHGTNDFKTSGKKSLQNFKEKWLNDLRTSRNIASKLHGKWLLKLSSAII